MRDYELMYIIAPSLGDDEACAAYADRINTMVTNNGGTIQPVSEAQSISGRRKLAYPMRRESKDVTEGYYVTTQFGADPQSITAIERELKLADPIMRYLITLNIVPATTAEIEQ